MFCFAGECQSPIRSNRIHNCTLLLQTDPCTSCAKSMGRDWGHGFGRVAHGWEFATRKKHPTSMLHYIPPPTILNIE
eukprot:2273797-Amphidinium_carterae.1